jgi:RHS repeat-associated protein
MGQVNFSSGTGTSCFYNKDHLGSVREMTNSSGTISGQLSYDPFGRTTVLQGTTLPDFQYAGYYLHTRSGLNLTRTRVYSAAFGRFISRDPIGEAGGVNLYAYVGNNPASLRDPMGLDAGYTSSGYDPDTAGVAQRAEADIQYMTSPAEGAQYWNNYMMGMGMAATEIGLGGLAGLLGARPCLPASPSTQKSCPMKYHPRLDQKTDPFHNFDRALDSKIMAEGKVTITNGTYTQYELPGVELGKNGNYEIGVQDEETIIHRFFRPSK